jgi:hypothetical protein
MMRVMRLSSLHLVLIELLFFLFLCGAAGLGSIFFIVVMVRGVLAVSNMLARVAVILMVRLLIMVMRGFHLIGQVLMVLLMVVFSC